MRSRVWFACSVFSAAALACGLGFPLARAPQNPKIFHGSISVQGSGVSVMCSIPQVKCSGQTSLSNLPSPDDFRLDVDSSGRITSGQAKFETNLKEHYSIEGVDNPCFGAFTGTSAMVYDGSIPLPAQGDKSPTPATFTGSLESSASGAEPYHCPEGSASPSGSGTLSQDGVTLDLTDFSPSMVEGSSGKCDYSVLSEFPKILSPFTSSCTYRIESVTTLILGKTPSP